jgi:ribose transport system permease protein
MTANTAAAKILRKPLLVSSVQALGMLPILILLALIFQFCSGFKETYNLAAALTSGRFISLQNLSIVAAQASINTVLAAGMTFVILTGGIDLSVGSVLAASAMLGLIVSLILTTRSSDSEPVFLLDWY